MEVALDSDQTIESRNHNTLLKEPSAMADIILFKTVLETSLELWRPIDGFPGYEVSNMGRVRSLWKRISGQSRGAHRVTIGEPVYLALGVHKQGYLQAYIYLSGKKYTRFVHRLVAKAFLPNPNNLPEVNHLTALKSDNRAANLEWASRARNQRHAYEIGAITAEMVKKGLSRGLLAGTNKVAKLTTEDVIRIRERCANGETKRSIAREYRIDESYLGRIVNGHYWKFIKE